MTRIRVALHEFMPYGAPDLIAEGGEARLRALGIAVAMWGLVFAALLAAVRLAPPAALPVAGMPEFEILDPGTLPPPPSLVRRPEAHAAHAPVTPARPAILVPVMIPPATPAVIDDDPGALHGDGVAAHGTDTAPPAAGDGSGVASERPDPAVWVAHDVEPEIVQRVVPDYPELAKEAHIEGTVYVQVLVGRDGRVGESIVRSGELMLRDAALEAARATRFRPATSNGHPVAVWVMMPFHFVLH